VYFYYDFILKLEREIVFCKKIKGISFSGNFTWVLFVLYFFIYIYYRIFK